LTTKSFPDGIYRNVPGLCAIAGLDEIEKQGWSLNPGRYVGMALAKDDGVDFSIRLRELNDQLQQLNADAEELQERISANASTLLELTE